MTTKQAISVLTTAIKGQRYVAATMRLIEVEGIIAALRASQKREAEGELASVKTERDALLNRCGQIATLKARIAELNLLLDKATAKERMHNERT